MNRWLGLGLLLIVLGALALRVPQLERRPMHNDEAVNATLVAPLWQDGLYKYNPSEYHGPALYYFTLPSIWLSHARDITQLDERTLRLVTVFFGVVLIVLVGLLVDGLGAGAVLAAGALLAISPAMVYYSRYYIHEMLLVCFSMLVLGAGWQYSRTRRGRWALLGGLGLGLMYATKETFVIPLGAMVLALILVAFWHQFQAGRLPEPIYWNLKHAVGALGAGALVSMVLFTSCFTNFSGPLDSLRSYLPWLQRAGGSQIYPAHFYLQRLAYFTDPLRPGPVWSEGLILFLALIGVIAALSGKGLGKINVSLARFLTIYTVILTLAYSAISYKTPWCMLGFLHGMILLAGIGVAFLFNVLRPWPVRTVLAILLVAATGQLGWQSWRTSQKYAADRRNPYAFSQTVPNILELVKKVEGVAKVLPPGTPRLVKVIAPEDESCWPLPWYFRDLTRQQIGYYSSVSEIQNPFPVMIISAQIDSQLDIKTNKKWLQVGLYELRPKVFFETFVEFDLWKKFIESQPRPKDD